ncbi:MAG: radical SAM protein [Candidatus Electrothrix aestuarii]|uniref:Radical SAM protein n=1 Tax=Candidatus Electrothrix aestuarii TaxID=3062594 RepID=A0AAU8LS92_9BACT|nr:radical SAM protein [Candidatus Electrothrix aestuarii]
MHYQGNIIRPPSEANSIILQVTVGCSHNRCTFCGAYRDPEQKFHIKDDHIIAEDIAFAARYCRRQKTVFLADGDALIIPHKKLLTLCQKIRAELPWVRRISLYANCRDILKRSAQELAELKQAGVGRIYMGLESGHELTLAAVKKGSTAEEMMEAGQRVREAGVFLSVTCLLGIAGRQYSQQHAEDTAAVLNQMQPSQIAVLTLMLLENTELGQAAINGSFQLPDQEGLFRELRTLLAGLDDFRCQFQANHASNYFTLDGRLPKDRETFLAIIDQALSGTVSLKPEGLRGL